MPNEPQIFELRQYVNALGQTIQSRTPVSDVGGMEGPATYFSGGVVDFQFPNGQIVQRPFQFDIPGATLGEAFENFPALFQQNKAKTEEAFQKELRDAQRQIMLPGNGNALPAIGNPRTRIK